jgi:hypothetical protein
MEEGLINTPDSELKKVWSHRTQSKYSKEYIELVRKELLSRGLPFEDDAFKKDSKPPFNFENLKILISFVCFSAFTVYCIVMGQVPGKLHTHYRDQDPFAYWLFIVGLISANLVLLGITISSYFPWSAFKFFEKPLDLLMGKSKKGSLKSAFSISEAKKFLSRKITETARRDGLDFDNLEEKMLYWTAEHEDMNLQDKFDAKHNNDDYEKKVAGLLKSAYAYDRKNDSIDLPKYNDAYTALQQGDYYLTVLLDKSIGNQISTPGSRWLGKPSNSTQDYLNLVLTGLVFCVLFIVSAFIYSYFFDGRHK